MCRATRHGVASSLNEIARAAQVGIVLDERNPPVPAAVRSACELLGLDPLSVANEGKLIAIVPASVAEALVAQMRHHPLVRNTTIIGQVTERHPSMVVARTGSGGTRVVDLQVGKQLTRICGSPAGCGGYDTLKRQSPCQCWQGDCNSKEEGSSAQLVAQWPKGVCARRKSSPR